MKTSDHSNEITAIPALLDPLKAKGCIVTIDAEGCQTEIARKIREKKADYVLAVKGNQPQLLEQTKDFLDVTADEDIGEKRTSEVRYFISSLGMDAENSAMMRRMARSSMKRDTHSKRSLKGRRRICSYNDRYLEQLLFNSDQTISEVRPG